MPKMALNKDAGKNEKPLFEFVISVFIPLRDEPASALSRII